MINEIIKNIYKDKLKYKLELLFDAGGTLVMRNGPKDNWRYYPSWDLEEITFYRKYLIK